MKINKEQLKQAVKKSIKENDPTLLMKTVNNNFNYFNWNRKVFVPLFIILTILKLAGIVALSWWIVFSPLIISSTFLILLIFIILLI